MDKSSFDDDYLTLNQWNTSIRPIEPVDMNDSKGDKNSKKWSFQNSPLYKELDDEIKDNIKARLFLDLFLYSQGEFVDSLQKNQANSHLDFWLKAHRAFLLNYKINQELLKISKTTANSLHSSLKNLLKQQLSLIATYYLGERGLFFNKNKKPHFFKNHLKNKENHPFNDIFEQSNYSKESKKKKPKDLISKLLKRLKKNS